MKKIFALPLLIVAVITLALAADKGEDKSKTSRETVAFYDVPLVCGAAPAIGCGSRAKPVFIDLEKHDQIREAWLNRPGTIIAVVWEASMKDEKERASIAGEFFTRHAIDAGYIKDKKRQKELLADFRSNGKWYKGTDVDQLSLEEAVVIGESSVKSLLEKKMINREEAAAIREEVTEYYSKDLVKVRSKKELDDDYATPEWMNYLHGVYKKHLGQDRADEIIAIYKKKQECENNGKKADCCKKDKKKSCCSKKNNTL